MEKERASVIIADDEPITRMDLKEILVGKGYDVVAEAGDGFDVAENCKKHHPAIVPLLDGLAAAKIISEENLADTIIILTAYSEKEFIDQAKATGVSGYLVKPIDEKALIPCIEVARARDRERRKLRKDIEDVSERLESRSIIERAKELVMQQQKLTGQKAYDYIRGLSRMKNVSMRRVSEIILAKNEG